eukprot:14821744-Heterocapsa_arctica.AAC.1
MVDHIHEQEVHNYNKWKYKKRKEDNMKNQKKKMSKTFAWKSGLTRSIIMSCTKPLMCITES